MTERPSTVGCETQRQTEMSKPNKGWSWDRRAVFVMVTAVAAQIAPIAANPVSAAGPKVNVIVREAAGAGNAPENAVRRYGGKVTQQLSLIHGFSAKLPSGAVTT